MQRHEADTTLAPDNRSEAQFRFGNITQSLMRSRNFGWTGDEFDMVIIGPRVDLAMRLFAFGICQGPESRATWHRPNLGAA